MQKRFILALVINSFLAGILFVYADWQAPLATPPTCDPGNPGCDAPLNVGGIGQVKQGGLTVGATGPLGVGFAVLNGNVGIGTASPGIAKTYVFNPGSNVGLYIGNGTPFGQAKLELDGPAATHIWVAEAGTRVFSVTSGGGGYFAGNVGIGTASPSYKLDVNGNARIISGLDVNSQRITSVATPIAGTDAVNKDYVDAAQTQYIVTTRWDSGSCTFSGNAPTNFCPAGWTVVTSWTSCFIDNTDAWNRQTLCQK